VPHMSVCMFVCKARGIVVCLCKSNYLLEMTFVTYSDGDNLLGDLLSRDFGRVK
jgi:hypothetical protein